MLWVGKFEQTRQFTVGAATLAEYNDTRNNTTTYNNILTGCGCVYRWCCYCCHDLDLPGPQTGVLPAPTRVTSLPVHTHAHTACLPVCQCRQFVTWQWPEIEIDTDTLIDWVRWWEVIPAVDKEMHNNTRWADWRLHTDSMRTFCRDIRDVHQNIDTDFTDLRATHRNSETLIYLLFHNIFLMFNLVIYHKTYGYFIFPQNSVV